VLSTDPAHTIHPALRYFLRDLLLLAFYCLVPIRICVSQKLRYETVSSSLLTHFRIMLVLSANVSSSFFRQFLGNLYNLQALHTRALRVGMCNNRNSVRIRFLKTEPSKNLTFVQTVFRQKLHAIRHSNKKRIKVTLLDCIKLQHSWTSDRLTGLT